MLPQHKEGPEGVMMASEEVPADPHASDMMSSTCVMMTAMMEVKVMTTVLNTSLLNPKLATIHSYIMPKHHLKWGIMCSK
jgi:hypothetical protein